MGDVSCDRRWCCPHANLLPSVFIIISAEQLGASGVSSASNQLGAEREDACNFATWGAVWGGRVT
jgi:hypothetical protein